ncbi:GPW/gp25 family protein [Paraburkholderia sp. MM5477-R1]|uniref:GPW/gp25 family protein n=1 Tax=Paraburkholderia sp. MM5477-R1 TaxID=2991062 RepID=UPI003D1A08E2
MLIQLPSAPDPRAFRGIGLAFPLAVTPQGALAIASDNAKIEQSVWLIVSTANKERVMRPQYGCGIHDLVFSPASPQSIGQIVDELRRALVAQEPRIDVLGVSGEIPAGESNLLLLRIDYQIRANNALANVVYPFFITEGS